MRGAPLLFSTQNRTRLTRAALWSGALPLLRPVIKLVERAASQSLFTAEVTMQMLLNSNGFTASTNLGEWNSARFADKSSLSAVPWLSTALLC